jgi:hypothetical protein
MLKIGAVMFFTTDSMRPAELAPVLEAFSWLIPSGLIYSWALQ